MPALWWGIFGGVHWSMWRHLPAVIGAHAQARHVFHCFLGAAWEESHKDIEYFYMHAILKDVARMKASARHALSGFLNDV